MRKNYSIDREKLLKFEAEGREFANFLRSLEQFIQTFIVGYVKRVRIACEIYLPNEKLFEKSKN